MAQLAPSILSCNFSQLKEQLLSAQLGGVKIIHIDVMDGHFVPNLTFGPIIIKAVREILPQAILDVHLMVDNPKAYIASVIQAGGDVISFHPETVPDYGIVIKDILREGAKASLALCPGTPIETIFPLLPELHQVLVMTVNPGFGGQKFISGMEDKILRMRKAIQERGLTTEIAIDGGVTEDNIEFLAACGASIIMAGSLVFSQPDQITEKVKKLRQKIEIF